MWHSVSKTMSLPLPVEEVFGFFADAGNLQRITPAELGFRILTSSPTIGEGARIDYRLRLCGIPFTWKTVITAWEPPHRFVDRQLRGPYKEWIHTHQFEPIPGGTLIGDDIRYRLPLSPLGEVAQPLVRLQLERIFKFRQEAIRRILVSGSGPG